MGYIDLVHGSDSSLEPVEYRVDRRLENEVFRPTTGSHGIVISLPEAEPPPGSRARSQAGEFRRGRSPHGHWVATSGRFDSGGLPRGAFGEPTGRPARPRTGPHPAPRLPRQYFPIRGGNSALLSPRHLVGIEANLPGARTLLR